MSFLYLGIITKNKSSFLYLLFLLHITPALTNAKQTISTTQNIHIFGDSHAYFGFSDNKKLDYFLPFNNTVQLHVMIHWFFSKTMHGFAKKEFNVGNYAFQENDILIFTFGEVDVRCHIGKQRDLFNRDVDEIIDLLISNYFKKIGQLLSYSTMRCIISEIMPPTDRCLNPQFPFYGSLQDRIAITKKFNQKLRMACEHNNVGFLPIYDLYALADGSLNLDLSDRCVHVSFANNYLTKQRLRDLLINAGLI